MVPSSKIYVLLPADVRGCAGREMAEIAKA